MALTSAYAVRKDSGLTTLKQLNSPNVTIAFSTGTYQDELTRRLMPKGHYRALPNLSFGAMISEIEAKHSDAVAIPSTLAALIARSPGFHWALAIPPTYNGIFSSGVAWAVRKGAANTTFLAYLDRFIRQERKNGTVTKLLHQYVTPKNTLG